MFTSHITPTDAEDVIYFIKVYLLNKFWKRVFSELTWLPHLPSFSRRLYSLRAAYLNQQVVVTGGSDGSNSRDEVWYVHTWYLSFLNGLASLTCAYQVFVIFKCASISCMCISGICHFLVWEVLDLTLQVLQYNVEAGSWSQMGRLKRGRYAHAVVEANLAAVFAASGNLNTILKKGKILHTYYITKTIILKAPAPKPILNI